jgi:hypothetical protein
MIFAALLQIAALAQMSSGGVQSPPALGAEVQVDRLDVWDRPNQTGYVTGTLRRGDRVRVRGDRPSANGWLAIEPLPTTICWIAESNLETSDDDAENNRAKTAWVHGPHAMIRSGNLAAKLPGPPLFSLESGTIVRLVDRPALRFGDGEVSSRWVVIAPPADLVCYVRASSVRWLTGPKTSQDDVTQASFESSPQSNTPSKPPGSSGTSPRSSPEITAELERLDGIYRVIIANQPIAEWRFESVRAGYQSLLKRSGEHLELEDALRTRLQRVTRSEQAAKAARTIEAILARSHRRDGEVAAVRKNLARLERIRARDYDAVGFIQPSARKVEGRKVFALIGGQGSAIAYLDIPPGLDPTPFLAHRIGVRGQAHFREDLGMRLIAVGDMERIDATK